MIPLRGVRELGFGAGGGSARSVAKGKLAIYNNDNIATPSTTAPEARNWVKILSQYREPDALRSVVEIAITLLPFALFWAATLVALEYSYLLSLLLAIPAAGFLLRLFLIQHDCGHGTFFQNRRVNDWVGRTLGILTLTPYDLWKRSHATHHATSGNLNRRGVGDIVTLTLSEYESLSIWRRLKYRMYRHPFVMFALGPAHLFLLQHRIPIGFMRDGSMPWVSTMATNAATAVIISVLVWFVGIKAFLLVQLPISVLAASVGVWLFYVQHQFETTCWDRDPEWKMHNAALHGSSFYDLPPVLRWITANIGMHHVHHLSSRIPYYKLPTALKDYPELKTISRVTLIESLRCVRFALWDESRRILISFREARHQAS
ncbi:MAG: fatty acid desaturase [Micropepsaceae bacterium]